MQKPEALFRVRCGFLQLSFASCDTHRGLPKPDVAESVRIAGFGSCVTSGLYIQVPR